MKFNNQTLFFSGLTVILHHNADVTVINKLRVFWFSRHKTANIQHERYPLRLTYFQAVALFCSRSNPRATLSADCTKSGWLSLQRSNTTYDSTNVYPSCLDCFLHYEDISTPAFKCPVICNSPPIYYIHNMVNRCGPDVCVYTHTSEMVGGICTYSEGFKDTPNDYLKQVIFCKGNSAKQTIHNFGSKHY